MAENTNQKGSTLPGSKSRDSLSPKFDDGPKEIEHFESNNFSNINAV